MNRGARPEPRRGAALLLSVWAVAALAAAGIAQATRLSLELKWMGRLEESSQSWYLCWTGLEVAASLLAEEPEQAWDAPRERWGQVPDEPVPFPGGAFLYQITDEQHRIPLNSAPLEVLLRLPGFTPQAADRLLARRAEEKPIVHLGELAQLEGFQPEGLAGLDPLVTLQPTGSVNLNTAPAAVLVALGLSVSIADRIVPYRLGPDGVAATADDAVFTDVERIAPDLEAALGPLLPEDQAALANLISSQRLGVRSSFFRVQIDGRSQRHEVHKRVFAIVDRGAPGDALRIRGWHESD